uniref:Putative LAGLIDADG homing endonuclease n=1 Tax=Coleochaete scutata TaxID=3125 RepID=A0A5P9NW30_COLSC|nr:putative LAGLIDADG homing endonuclease [Coleochaete scutata]QFU80162.1 putative LAGLIDADG homing endonuclease [Coleochaete scutata]
MMHKRSFHMNNIRAIKRIGPHNNDVISVIVGSLLGDAYANRRSGEGVRICFRQGSKNKEYLFWLYNFFYSKGYTSNLQPREYTRKIKQRLGGTTKDASLSYKVSIYKGYEFNTFTFRSLNWIYNLFYKKGIKVISPQIADYLTPLALTVWIMDDGGWANPGVRIATNCFTFSEVTFLNDILKNKYKLDTTIQSIWMLPKERRNKYSIYIKKNSIPKLISIIFPYMDKSMHYKLGLV